MKAVALGIHLLVSFALAASAANLNQATVTRVVRSVEVIPAGAAPKPAALGEIVSGNSDIRTGEESRAQLTFPDRTLARLGENTVFSFDRGTRALDLESGAILLQVPKDAGGATIRSAPVTATITGTTVMMEYSPGNPGTVKFICLEGTARLALAGRLGESVLISPGQMISVAANARSLPDPSVVDVRRLLRTSRLVRDGELEAMGMILETAQTQQQMLRSGELGDSRVASTPDPANPAMVAVGALDNLNLRRDTVPDVVPAPPAAPEPLQPPAPPPPDPDPPNPDPDPKPPDPPPVPDPS
jgi:ferric-dicitrate binding protein FerR (iron transport regulator)